MHPLQLVCTHSSCYAPIAVGMHPLQLVCTHCSWYAPNTVAMHQYSCYVPIAVAMHPLQLICTPIAIDISTRSLSPDWRGRRRRRRRCSPHRSPSRPRSADPSSGRPPSSRSATARNANCLANLVTCMSWIRRVCEATGNFRYHQCK